MGALRTAKGALRLFQRLEVGTKKIEQIEIVDFMMARHSDHVGNKTESYLILCEADIY